MVLVNNNNAYFEVAGNQKNPESQIFSNRKKSLSRRGKDSVYKIIKSIEGDRTPTTNNTKDNADTTSFTI